MAAGSVVDAAWAEKILQAGGVCVFQFNPASPLTENIGLHCVAWVLARSMSPFFSEKKHSQGRAAIKWTHLSWSVRPTPRRASSLQPEPVVPGPIVDLVALLNSRCLHLDVLLASAEVKLGMEALTDSSSYLYLAANGRYHDVTRIRDRKWQQVAK